MVLPLPFESRQQFIMIASALFAFQSVAINKLASVRLHRKSRIAFRFGQSGTFSEVSAVQVALCLLGERLQYKISILPPPPSSPLARVVPVTECRLKGIICPIGFILGDEYPGEREVLELAQVAQIIIGGQVLFAHP
jgi:hypothetical protein